MHIVNTRGGLVADTAATAKIASTANLCSILITAEGDFLPKDQRDREDETKLCGKAADGWSAATTTCQDRPEQRRSTYVLI